MKKRNAVISFALVMSLPLVGCSQSTTSQTESGQETGNKPTETPKEEKKIVLKLGHGTASSSLFHAGSIKFKELVEAKSNGQIQVNIYTDGQIGHDKDLIDFMGNNNVQMGMIGVEPLMTLLPKLQVVGMPYIFPDRETAYKVLDGELGAEMVEALPAEHGVRVLSFFESGFRHVSNSKQAIELPEDLQGLKIRTPQNPVSLSIFKSFGSNPTPMSFGELFMALEQKTVDGQENPLALIYASKFHEVQAHIALTSHTYSPMALAISEKQWSSLTPELQKVVQEAANEARDDERKLSAEQEADFVQKLETEGVKISKPDIAPFKEATKDVHKEFDDGYGADFYEKVMKATSD